MAYQRNASAPRRMFPTQEPANRGTSQRGQPSTRCPTEFIPKPTRDADIQLARRIAFNEGIPYQQLLNELCPFVQCSVSGLSWESALERRLQQQQQRANFHPSRHSSSSSGPTPSRHFCELCQTRGKMLATLHAEAAELKREIATRDQEIARRDQLIAQLRIQLGEACVTARNCAGIYG